MSFHLKIDCHLMSLLLEFNAFVCLEHGIAALY